MNTPDTPRHEGDAADDDSLVGTPIGGAPIRETPIEGDTREGLPLGPDPRNTEVTGARESRPDAPASQPEPAVAGAEKPQTPTLNDATHTPTFDLNPRAVESAAPAIDLAPPAAGQPLPSATPSSGGRRLLAGNVGDAAHGPGAQQSATPRTPRVLSQPVAPPGSPLPPAHSRGRPGNAMGPGAKYRKARVQLPNGTVGKRFEAQVRVDWSGDPPQMTSVAFEGLEEQGLSFDVQAWTISGIPRRNGEFRIVMRYSLLDREGRRETGEAPITLLINPDPKTLWKEVEPSADLPYRKDHTDHRRELFDDILMVGASRRGRSHAHKGTFRDDDFQIRTGSGGRSFMFAVADGAGSAQYSRKGAEIVCRSSMEHMSAFLESHLGVDFDKLVERYVAAPTKEIADEIRARLYQTLVQSAFAGYKAIVAEARQRGTELKDYATTLILTYCKRFTFGWFVSGFAIGDGGAGVIVDLSSAQVKVLSRPDSGEFSGQTRFVTMPDVWTDFSALQERIRFDVVNDLVALVAMTDGVTDPFFPTENDFFEPQQWVRFWEKLGQSVNFSKGNEQVHEQLLEWLNFWVEGEHDDRTITLLLP